MTSQDKISSYFLLLWSENPDKLQMFYRDILELEPAGTLTLPDDYGYMFKIGEHKLWIGKHSEVKGKNKDKYRMMVNFYVKDINFWQKKLKSKGVEIIVEPFITPPTRKSKNKRYAMTFLDPEGNCLQMMTVK